MEISGYINSFNNCEFCMCHTCIHSPKFKNTCNKTKCDGFNSNKCNFNKENCDEYEMIK